MTPNEKSSGTEYPREMEKQTHQSSLKSRADGPRKLIGYRGCWYDVTNFVKIHPGGNIIERFIGKDATCEIDVKHHHDVMKHRVPIKSVNKEFSKTEFNKDMLNLHKKLKLEGFYDNSIPWFIMKSLFTLFIGVSVFVIVWSRGDNGKIIILAGLLLALFWQQSGLLMHDFMHSTAFQRMRWDEVLGIFFGSVCFGMSSRWWKDEHIEHHALTNVVDYKTKFVDPQAHEDVWAQNPKLFPFVMPKAQRLIKIQHYLFLPLCVLIGRIGLLIDSYRDERRRDVIMAIVLHWIWVIGLLSMIPSWTNVFVFYYTASVGEGILHIQLLMNHYSKPFYEKTQRHNEGFFYSMIKTNINIVNPIWMDWFHGGLNFHIEHHCFPRLPRNRCREVSAMIKNICKRHNVDYDECSFSAAFLRTLRHLRDVSKLYSPIRP